MPATESPMSTMYRADRNADLLATAREGWCLTDNADRASAYGRNGWMATIEIDLGGLTVVEVAGYDRNENETPADSAAFRAAHAAAGADVLVYQDEDERGRQHTTWRLVSERAIAACRIVSVDEV